MKRWVLVLVLTVTSCAAPPVTLYTLEAPLAASPRPSLRPNPVVVEVARVSVPDSVDTQDILVREGTQLVSSPTGRWASRLSLGVTNRLTERLGARYPHELVTDRLQNGTPALRVLVTVGRLEISHDGVGALSANWEIIPSDPKLPVQRNRGLFEARGPVKTDAQVVAMVGDLVDQLAARIALPPVR
jgi:uncharacterized lipoprotein YmbA